MRKSLFVAALLLASCKPPAAVAPRPAAPLPRPILRDWPTYHGSYALDGLAAEAPPDAPVLLWRWKAGARVHAVPLVADGSVYVAHSKGGLAALGPDGRELWKVQLGKDAFDAPLLYAEKTLFIGSGAGILYAVDAATGKEKWTYAVGDALKGSANRVDLAGGRVGIIAVSSSDGAVHCVDAETGKPAWKTPEFERCDGSPSSLGGRVVLGSCASALHVFDVAKGAKAADVEIGGDSQVAGGAALSGTEAFAGTRVGKLVAADVASGKLLWSNADSKKEAFTTPAVNDERVVFGSDDFKVYALDRKTGVQVWSVDTGDTPTSPVIAGNRVVVGSGGSLLILDLRDGRTVWKTEVSDDITAPAVAGGVIYVGGDDGSVSAWGKK